MQRLSKVIDIFSPVKNRKHTHDNTNMIRRIRGRSIASIIYGLNGFVVRNHPFCLTYGKISLLTNLFPSVPLLTLTGTTTRATKSGIINVFGLSNPVVTVESNPFACNVALSSGFPIDMIALVLQHLLELTSVEKVENVLPVYCKEMAATISSFIQKHLATETSTAASP